MAHSNRTLQRLCIAGVSTATLIAGLPFLATAASAAHVTDVEFFSPFQANTLTSNTDGTDTTARLLVDAPASVVAVQYSYQVNTGTAAVPVLGAPVAIGTPVTARPFTANFNTLTIPTGTNIRLSATGTNSAGGTVSVATQDVTINNGANGVNVTSPSSVTGAGTTIGRFNGQVIVTGTVTPGYTGNVTVADILGGAAPSAGPAIAPGGARTVAPVNGAFSTLVPTFSATSANAYINASITAGAGAAAVTTDETELAAVYEQTVAAPTVAPASLSSQPSTAGQPPITTPVTATVLDQNGKPVGGALVDLDLNPADAGVDGTQTTNTAGQVTFNVPSPTTAGTRQISFIANQDQTSGLNSAAGDKVTTVTQTTAVPIVTTAAITSVDPTPQTTAPGTTAAPFPAFPTGSTSFDIAEEDPEIRVDLKDQSGNAQAAPATVSYRVTFDPEGTNVVAGVDTLGPRRLDNGGATGYAQGTSSAQGFFTVPSTLVGKDAVTPGVASKEGTYTVEAFVNKDADAAPSAADVLATPVTYTFDGASLSSDAGATSQSEAGTATTRAFTYRLDNGTVLGGRLVNLNLANGAALTPATNAPAIFTATQPAGTTRTGDRTAYGVTDATTGKVTASVTDPTSTSGTPAAQDQETVTLAAVAASSGRTAATDIAFIRGASPTVARLAAVQFPYGAQDATPGRPVTLTVKVDNGTVAAPGTSLAGQTVALSTDRGYFTSRANTAAAPVTSSDDGVLTPAQLVPATTPTGTGAQVGAYARNGAGKTLTTDANGNVRFTVAIDKDTEFDNDGLATATVTVRVGNVTRTLPVVFSTDASSTNNVALVNGDSAELDTTGDVPLNPGLSNPLQIVAVPGDAVVSNRAASADDPGFQAVAVDGFGNRAGYPVSVGVDNGSLDDTPTNGTSSSTQKTGTVFTSYTGDAEASFTTSSSLAAFQTTGTAEATEIQTVSAAQDVPTTTYADADGVTAGFQFSAGAVTNGTARVSDTQAVSYYSPLASAFTYAFASTPGNTVQVGTAVNTVVTVKDARGNAVQGLNARFIRSGPGDQVGDSFSNNQVIRTNANGQAGYTFTSPTTGTATVTVIVTTDAGIELSRGVQNVSFTATAPPNGVAPVISGATQRFSPFGAPLTISGTAPAGSSVAIFFDRRGPETAKQVATLTATAAGTFSAQFTPGDDYSVYAVVGNTASNTIVAFTSPTVSGPATQFGPRNGTIVLTGRGAPGSTLDISFRAQGTSTFNIKQRLTVGTNGVWTRPLSLRQNYAFYVQRSAGQNSPRTGIYVAAGR